MSKVLTIGRHLMKEDRRGNVLFLMLMYQKTKYLPGHFRPVLHLPFDIRSRTNPVWGKGSCKRPQFQLQFRYCPTLPPWFRWLRLKEWFWSDDPIGTYNNMNLYMQSLTPFITNVTFGASLALEFDVKATKEGFHSGLKSLIFFRQHRCVHFCKHSRIESFHHYFCIQINVLN